MQDGKIVYKSIEQLFRNFLWSGNENKSSGAKVSWFCICFPKSEGGLGLRKINEWNIAANLKHIWDLFCNAGSVWVAWSKAYLLRGNSFWNVNTPYSCMWAWRKLLKLRTIARPLIKHIIGNGSNTFLWHDFWYPLGPLTQRFDPRIMYDAAISTQGKVSSIISNHSWVWPSKVTADLLELHHSTTPSLMPNSDMEDKIIWTPDITGSFSTRSA